MVDIKKPLGSYHIIDGEKVSVRYWGQQKTCARCHQIESVCPGKAWAGACENADAEIRVPRVLLSDHMTKHWEAIDFVPDEQTDLSEEVNIMDFEIQDGKTERKTEVGPVFSDRHKGVKIHNAGTSENSLDEIYSSLVSLGLPSKVPVSKSSTQPNKSMIIIDDIYSTLIEEIRSALNGKRIKIGDSKEKKITVQYDVAASPTKKNEIIDSGDAASSCRKNKATDSPSTLMETRADVKKSRN